MNKDATNIAFQMPPAENDDLKVSLRNLKLLAVVLVLCLVARIVTDITSIDWKKSTNMPSTSTSQVQLLEEHASCDECLILSPFSSPSRLNGAESSLNSASFCVISD